MITIDLTMWIHIGNMLFLIVALNTVLYRPVRKMLAERKAKISDLGNEIETFQANAKSRSEEFDQKFRDARRNAKSEFDSARNEAQESGAAKLKQIKEESDKIKADHMSKVTADIQAAEQSLKGQVESFATDMAGKVLGRAL